MVLKMLPARFGPKLRQYAIVITVNLSILCGGMALGWSSPALVHLSGNTTALGAPVADDDGSWVVSSVFLVAAFASLFSSLLLDNLGRKSSVILASVPHIIGCLLIIFAKQVWQLILARTFVGVSMAWSFNVSPTYVAEVASTEIRGSLGTILQITCCAGATIMLAVGPFVSYLTLNIIYATIVIFTALPVLFLPDSPYYLYCKGRIDEATKILISVRGSESLAKQEIAEYAVLKCITKRDKQSLLKDQIFHKTLAIGFIFAVFTQITGSNTVEFYLQPILTSFKSTVSPTIASAVIGLIKLAGGVFTAFFTERFGRKPILIWSYIGMAVGMVGFGTFFIISEEIKQLCFFINYIPILCLVLNTFASSTGQGSIFYSMITEMFEGHSRALGISAVSFIASMSTFFVANYFVAFKALMGQAVAFWIFGVFCIFAAVFVVLCLPETKGKIFAEIQRTLGRKS